MDDEEKGIDRREFMKAALAIGGSSALMAARSRASLPPSGTTDRSSLPDRQYAWNDYSSVSDSTGLAKTPNHHLQFMLDYAGDGVPTESEQEQVEEALRTIEEAFEWSNDGVLFTIGYSPSYFDRFDESLPEGTGLRRPEEVIDEVDVQSSGKIEADNYDAHMHLASDNAAPLLEVEEALFGELDTMNSVSVDSNFVGVFEKKDRRTGFIGNPHEMWDEEINAENNPIGEDAPVWFGFKSLFTDSQPTEDDVAITDEDHPFFDGTTEQVSLMNDNIQEWYGENDHEERVDRMYSPHHTSEDAGQHGRNLAPTSGTENTSDDGGTMEEFSTKVEEDAEEKGVVGHAQKLARSRDPIPPILRRDFPSTDTAEPHTQFISNQRTIDDFIDVRKAMSFVDHESENPQAESEVPLKNHGILGYLNMESRGAFLVPPRDLRALPPARP